MVKHYVENIKHSKKIVSAKLIFIVAMQLLSTQVFSQSITLTPQGSFALGYQTFSSTKPGLTLQQGALQPAMNFNLGLEAKGEALNTPAKFNTYFLMDNHGKFKMSSYLFTFGTKERYLSYGDKNSFNFTAFTLSQQSLNGGKIFYSFPNQGLELQLAVAESKTKREGTDTTNGQFQQMLTGIRAVKKFNSVSSVGLSYYNADDNKNSIKIKGPTLQPISNNVASLDFTFKPGDKLSLKTEIANSHVNADESKDRPGGTGYAFSFNSDYRFSDTASAQLSFKQVDYKYYSTASLGILGDINKRKINLGLTKSVPSFLNSTFTLGFGNATNNLKETEAKPRTYQNTGSIILGFMPFKNFSFNTGYSLSRITGSKDTFKVDDRNTTLNSSLTFTFLENASFMPAYTFSQYRNKISSQSNTNTKDYALRLMIPLGSQVSAGYAFQRTSIDFVSTGENSKTQTHNFSLTSLFMDGRVAGTLNVTSTRPENATRNINNKTKGLVLGMSYKLDNWSTLNAYYQSNWYEDYVNSANDYQTQSVNLSYAMSLQNNPMFKGSAFKKFSITNKPEITQPRSVISTPLEIHLETDYENQILKTDFIELMGKALSSYKITQLTLNGKGVYFTPVNETKADFTYPIFLTQTETHFNIKAEDAAGNVAEKAITVTYDSKAPEFTIEFPETMQTDTSSLILTGGVRDDTGLKELTIDDTSFALKGEKEFAFKKEIQLKDGENKIKLVAEDQVERKSVKEITVLYTVPKVEEIKKEEKPEEKVFVGEIMSIGPEVVGFWVPEKGVVSEGQILYIKRKDKIIGKVKIRKIKKDIIIAEIVELNVPEVDFDDVITNQSF